MLSSQPAATHRGGGTRFREILDFVLCSLPDAHGRNLFGKNHVCRSAFWSVESELHRFAFLLIRALGRALANDVFSIRSPSYFVGRGADPVLASPAVQALFVCVAVGDFKDVELSSIFGPCSAKLAAAVKSVCPRYHDVKSSPICRIA